MARKKQKRKSKNDHKEVVSTFWPLSGAIAFILIALLLALGMFGAGGSLPVKLYDTLYLLLGWATVLTPMAAAYFGINKFVSEDKQIPLNKLLSMIGVLVFSSVWLHAAFINEEISVLGRGGSLGKIIGDFILQFLNKAPTSLIFFILALLAFFWSFGISPRVIMNVINFFKRAPGEDQDLEGLQRADKSLKLREGVPIGRSEESEQPKLVGAEAHEALTVPTDPDWQFPSLDLLDKKQEKADPGDVEANALAIAETLANFNIAVEMEGANIGPRLTQYTLKPQTGVKLSKITALEKNLELDLSADSIRVEAPIPGKGLVGVEVPNKKPATVTLHSVMTSDPWGKQRYPLSFVIGKDISGEPIVGNLASMPHLLIAGQTNSGKSVMINTLLGSLLYHNSPSDLKLIMVDPKLVELSTYNEIPHLLTPVITEPEKCVSALKWAVAEMERRLKTMSEVNRSNIADYNALKKEESMPYILIVIDELAEFMFAAGRDLEALIVRIAQKARATGIHLVLATQRPSVNVITGLIKANVPARIAFTVTSQVDSRVVIDHNGAEKLLGKGDMLFTTADMPKPRRMQGAFISKDEVIKVTDFLREQRPPQYDAEVISQPVSLTGRGGVVADYGSSSGTEDPKWQDAVKVVVDSRKGSTALLQRRLSMGYSRAARIIDTMEEQGIVGPADGARPREVLISSVDDVFGKGQSSPDDSDEIDEA